ncbi:MAG: TonB-dependent receptor plug domain-containing protein, partial [Gammaproteobacteria bacterium]
AQDAAQGLEEVVVTGSRIQKANLVTSSPVSQFDAEQLQFTGITRLEDVLKDLPQIYQGQGAGQSNGATGTATIDLRNLGTVRTLVLVDGKRLPVGSPLQAGGADINQIPGALIKRVEVLTGGASAAYGSDAVAGVVNFIMVDDFEGVKLDYQYSRYRHNNDGNKVAELAALRGYPVAEGSVSDGDISDASFIIGGNLNEGRGNVVAYATYRDIEAVLQSERDYSACALSSPANTACGGSGTHDKGRFTDFSTYNFRLEGNEFVPNAGYVYNFAPLNYFQRPDERYTAGAFAHYQVNEHVDAYTQIMFMDDRTLSQIAPSGAFFVTSTISCENPFLSDQQVAAIGCGGRVGEVPGYIGRRNVEGGGRQQDLRHTMLRGVFGVRGDINDNWRYDVSYQYAEVSMENTYLNDFGTSRIGRALDAVRDPATGEVVCRSVLDGSDPSCVPWNIFQAGGVTQDALNYLQLPLFARGTTDQTVFSAFVAGNLGEYGIKMPSAENGVDVVLGVEWREENLDFNPDDNFRRGEGAGQGGPTLPLSGGYEVAEWYAEASVPLIEGADFAEAVTLDLGYRYSDYDTDQLTDTYKIALGWAIDEQVKFRGSFQRAVRAANINELFGPQGLGLFDLAEDPCADATGGLSGTSAAGYTFDQCARSGITQAQWLAGTQINSPAGQYNVFSGGNPNLEPEEADTFSVGVVLSPNFVEGLDISIDYWDIDIEKAIGGILPETIIFKCIEEGQFCNNIQRGPNGNLWIGNAQVQALTDNIAFLQVKGWDIIADYQFDIADWGTIALNNSMSIVDSCDFEEYDGAGVVACEVNWNSTCGYPNPDFRNVLRTTWVTPWNVTVALSWRHIPKIEDVDEITDLDSINYFDLAGSWDITDYASVRLGVNNLFDEEPAFAGFNAGPSNNGNGSTFPGLYDALGQYWFMGGELKF